MIIFFYFRQIIIMGEVGDPNVEASIAVDDVTFDNKTCEEFPQGMVRLFN